jgi:cytochrome P450
MSTADVATVEPAVPDHVPRELVRSFDYIRDPGLSVDPWARMMEVAADNAPIFWSTELGGHWVVTRQPDIYEIMANPKDFSNYPAMLGPTRFPVLLIPAEIDPPEHTRYRQIMATYFSPRRVNELKPKIAEICENIVGGLADKGECDFVRDVAQQLPTILFAELMGVPFSEVPMYLRWVHDYLHNTDIAAAKKTGDEIVQYLNGLIDKRRGEPPSDLITVLLNANVGDRPITDDEVQRYAFLLFTGGLDTLISVMGYAFKYLAEHPELRHQLIAEPALIDNCAIEMFRRFSIVSRSRHATRDLEFRGIHMKQGDGILVAGSHASLDPAVFPDPLTVKPDRKNANLHGAFSYGPHRCLGSFLAEAEMRAIMKAWLARIPDFEVVPGAEFRHYTGIFGISSLPLRWKQA